LFRVFFVFDNVVHGDRGTGPEAWGAVLYQCYAPGAVLLNVFIL